jgi:hypothetical protein
MPHNFIERFRNASGLGKNCANCLTGDHQRANDEILEKCDYE